MGWLVALTCILLARSAWERRWTLLALSDHGKLTERTLTTCLLLQAVGLFLMSSLSGHTAGRLLHAVTGQWHIDAWGGHCCFLAAAGMMTVNVASRLDITHNQVRASFRQYFTLPMTIVAPVLLALLVMSPGADLQTPDMFVCETDWWADAYWSLLCGFVIFILAHTLAALTTLRRDRRNRRTANLYIAAIIGGILSCLARVITAWTDIPMLELDRWFWIAACSWCSAFAYIAGRTWRKKVRQLGGEPARL